MKSLFIIFSLLVSSFCFGAESQVREVQKSTDDKMLAKWARPPRIFFKDEILKGYDRDVVILFETEVTGWVKHAEVIKSSGLDDVDNLVLQAVQKAKFRAWNAWDVKTNYPARAKQPFHFAVSRDPKFENEPRIVLKKSDLEGENRSLSIYLEADNSGKITKAEIAKSSGSTKLDNYILKEFKDKASFKPLNINGKPYPIKKTKELYFSLNSAEEG
ncbi:energy transducer TonB family protein [Acinetobacter bereziniae]|uniref:energy transducer TonB family protein n=1 Tax=Acinetobacter bereziniae TaxID=106648 RepID=UPI00125F90E7|nr:energy transducer TonB [Acinetobacter bereziniae]